MKVLTFFLIAAVFIGVAAAITFGIRGERETANKEGSTKVNKNISVEQTALPSGGEEVAIIETDQGTITLRLFEDATPETVKNFKELAESGKYQNMPFHRVIDNFMIQSGDFENHDGSGGHSYQGPGTTIPDEFHDDLTHIEGAVSMAKPGDPATGKAKADSAGSQFFIVEAEQGAHFLDGSYPVFAQVIDGIEVVHAIAAQPTTGPEGSTPIKPILIKSIRLAPYQPRL